MKESKRSKPQVDDRLSELPNSVIFHIMWFVPMSDVVKTTFLSKRWRNLWTTLPFLNFDNGTLLLDYDTERFRNFISRALLHWNGIRVLKFKVDSCSEFLKDSIYSDIDSWLNFATERKVEELYLHLLLSDFECGRPFDSADEMYCVPQYLFSCSSLTILSLKVCNFTITRNVQWNQLKSLTITECSGVTEYVVNEILSGSPMLEVLNLSFVDLGENLNIRSSSLKELSIRKYSFKYEGISLVSELTIWTPNLETLKIEGMPYSSCLLLNVTSLTIATIEVYGLIYWDPNSCEFLGMDLKSDFVSSQDYIGEKFIQILETIRHVESVSLSYCCLKVFRAMTKRSLHSSFPNVKSVKIGCCYGNYEQLVGLSDIFPQLESLVLQDKKDCQKDLEAVGFETTIPKSFLLLRTIEVTWSNGDSIFPVLETLLKYASKLEKMVFRISRSSPRSSITLVSNKLVDMQRSTTNCKIHMII